MNIVDFLTKLGEKFAPVDASTIKGVQIQLTDDYVESIENYKRKIKMNDQIKFEMENLNTDLERAVEGNNPEAGKAIAEQIAQLNGKIQKPTIIEKACHFFDRPYVKLLLLLSFGLVSALVAKYLLNKSKAKDEDLEEEPDNFNNQGGNYPPMYGYPTLPPYPYQPFGRGQQQRY